MCPPQINMEKLDVVNKRLVDHFGISLSGMPIWRIVWSEDQFEKRMMEYSDAGVALLYPEMREVPKYRQYIHNKWILEKLVIVPAINEKELAEKVSYEPMFVFETSKHAFLPYNWEAAKFIIDTVNAAMGKQSMFASYVDPEADNPQEKRNERIEKLQTELFGNETATGDALAHRYGVAGFHPKVH